MTGISDKISSSYTFHKTLNSKIWDEDTHDMIPEVRLKLLKETFLFYKFLAVPGLQIHDVIVAGSNAAYNYTAKSDLDIHVVVDFAQQADSDLLKNLCDTKRFLWSYYYSIKVKNIPTEIYVEDFAQPVQSNGIYSILWGKWIKFPDDNAPEYDNEEIKRKVVKYGKDINQVLTKMPTAEHLDHLFNRIHSLRTEGLEHGGEYSTDNVVYKVLRSLGYLDKMFDLKNKIIDQEYSLS